MKSPTSDGRIKKFIDPDGGALGNLGELHRVGLPTGHRPDMQAIPRDFITLVEIPQASYLSFI